jgi:Ca2+-binding RTX toxin-like protein
MIGGAGDDTYVVDDTADYLQEAAGQGLDQVRSSVSWTLGDNVEQLVLTGRALNGVGNGLDNALVGNDLGNSLSGGAGSDWISGADGADTLAGDAGADWLEGGAGADWLDGGTEVDVMIGGAGDDTYVVDNAADYLQEAAGQGLDQVRSAVSWNLGENFEQLILTGTALYGSGNGLGNAIVGNAQNNGVGGGAGADWISLGDGADTGLGQDGDDWIEGGAGNDTLDGGLGADILVGGTGADRFVFGVGGGHDIVTDFERGDSLDFSAYTGTGVTWTFQTTAGGVEANFSNGDSVLLMGFTQALSSTDGHIFG